MEVVEQGSSGEEIGTIPEEHYEFSPRTVAPSASFYDDLLTNGRKEHAISAEVCEPPASEFENQLLDMTALVSFQARIQPNILASKPRD